MNKGGLWESHEGVPRKESFDISGSLLTVDVDKEVTMVIWGRPSELMVKTEPIIYRNLVTIENGQIVLYVNI